MSGTPKAVCSLKIPKVSELVCKKRKKVFRWVTNGIQEKTVAPGPMASSGIIRMSRESAVMAFPGKRGRGKFRAN